MILKLTDQSILTELKASGNLPSPTGVALTILELTRDPDTSVEDLALVLHGDPALAGKILKYANSAIAGSREEISSINDALVRLGMGLVRQLCLGFSVLSNARGGPCPVFDYNCYWRRSLGMAVASQALAPRLSMINSDEAFTCGLLAHIGILALASVYPDEYAKILGKWDRESFGGLRKLELEALSTDHFQVAEALFADWGLPEFYQIAVLHHQDADLDDVEKWAGGDKKAWQLAMILKAALLVSRIGVETGIEQRLLVLDYLKMRAEYNVSQEDWTSLFDQIAGEWLRMGHVLGIKIENLPSMELLARQAMMADVVSDQRKTPRAPICSLAHKIADREKTGAEEGPVAAPDPQADPTPKTPGSLDILVGTADDEFAAELQGKLVTLGHRVVRAADGRKTLELALENSPQLILVDWDLPQLDGLELCRTLRQASAVGHIHVIVMSDPRSSDQLAEAFDSMVDDYLFKPLDEKLLAFRLSVVQRVIGWQEQATRDREEMRKAVKEKSLANRQLAQMALEDPLTRLPNRRAGLTRLEEEWSRTRRNDESLMCMLLDIDHFKLVNDNYGHDIGDVVLQMTAAVLKNTMRNSDLVCRFGGEEFLVVCPGADIEMAKILGDRIRVAIEKNHIKSGEFDKSITISVGVALRNPRTQSINNLIKEADQALYAAKEAGRNKVCISNPN